jgi:hypothetical protein
VAGFVTALHILVRLKKNACTLRDQTFARAMLSELDVSDPLKQYGDTLANTDTHECQCMASADPVHLLNRR